MKGTVCDKCTKWTFPETLLRSCSALDDNDLDINFFDKSICFQVIQLLGDQKIGATWWKKGQPHCPLLWGKFNLADEAYISSCPMEARYHPASRLNRVAGTQSLAKSLCERGREKGSSKRVYTLNNRQHSRPSSGLALTPQLRCGTSVTPSKCMCNSAAATSSSSFLPPQRGCSAYPLCSKRLQDGWSSAF